MRAAVIGATLLAFAGQAQAGGFGGHGGGHGSGGHGGSFGFAGRAGGSAALGAQVRANAQGTATARSGAFGRFGDNVGSGAYRAARGGFVYGPGFGRGYRHDRGAYGYAPFWGFGGGYYDGSYGYAPADYSGDAGLGPQEPYGFAEPGFGPPTPSYAPRLPVSAYGPYAISGEGAYAYGYNGYAETPSLDASAPAFYPATGPCGC